MSRHLNWIPTLRKSKSFQFTMAGQPTVLWVSIKETAYELLRWLWALPFLPYCDGFKWLLPSLVQPLSWVLTHQQSMSVSFSYSNELLHIQWYFLWYKISSLSVNGFFTLLSCLECCDCSTAQIHLVFTVWVCEIKQIYRECVPLSLWISHSRLKDNSDI